MYTRPSPGGRTLFDTLRQFWRAFRAFRSLMRACTTRLSPGTRPTPCPSRSVWRGHARCSHEDYSVLALIGDGAMSGGLSFEGLNNAGRVAGAAHRHSQRQRHVHQPQRGRALAAPGGSADEVGVLSSSRSWYRDALEHTQAGQKVYELSHDVKTALKKSMLPKQHVL